MLLPSYNQALHVARRVDGKVRLGPVLATFQSDSASNPVYAYGAGSLWIYEEQGPGGATLFRVSLATGALLQAVRSPALIRPFLVADDDGAWLIPAGSFGAPTDVAIYHLSPSSGRVVPALTLPGYSDGFAMWAVATAHDVYADFCPRPVDPSTCTLFGLSGPSARPIFHLPSPATLAGGEDALVGDGAVYVLASTNVVSTSSPPNYDWSLVRIDMSTGTAATVTSVVLPQFWNAPDGTRQPNAVIVNRTILLLTNPDSDESGLLEEIQW